MEGRQFFYICANSDFMIQRIQSVLLFVAAILLISLFYFKIASLSMGQTIVDLDLCYTKSNDLLMQAPIISFVLYAPYLVLALVGLLLVTVFMYKNRKRQMLLTSICFLLNLVYLALMLMAPDQLKEQLINTVKNPGEWEISYGPGAIIPIVTIFLIIVSRRQIKKDDELVRAADRLR